MISLYLEHILSLFSMVKSSTGVNWLISIKIAKARHFSAFVELNDDMKSTCRIAYQANTMYEDTILLGSSGDIAHDGLWW